MNNTFHYIPSEEEKEKASYSYLISLVSIIAGLPLPIVNLVATLIFFFGNIKSTPFVRWHCTQALLLQISLFFFNSFGFWWTISIIFTQESMNKKYVFYILFVVILNIIEFIATIYTSIQVRKGVHVKWFVYGYLTDAFISK